MATFDEWLAGTRPRTLPAAAAPVIAGTGAAAGAGGVHAGRALLALAVALFLQIGVNFANDYSDGVRGTDATRVGPRRLTASGAATPSQVKSAAMLFFGLAAVCGLVLAWLSGAWWLVAVGAVAILTAWGYTGGRNPYGYRGLGDIMVFVFFGLVATIGTVYTQVHSVPWAAWFVAVGIGLIACALLMINNLRDIPTDAAAGKHTLAVRLGDRTSRRVYAGYLFAAIALGLACIPYSGWSALVLLLIPPAVVLALGVLAGAKGRLLVPVLGGTGLFELGYGVLMAIALAAH